MLKRLKYVSRAPAPLSDHEMRLLGETSARNNQRDDITGILVEAAGLFFQVLEGPAEAVDRLFDRIRTDSRHEDIVLLNTMVQVESRLFPDWAMKTVRLGADGPHTEAIKLLIETAAESHRQVERLARGIERVVWSEVSHLEPETTRRTDEVKPGR